MNSEEKVKKEIWYVLKRLKEESLRTTKSELIEYWVHFDFLGGEGPAAKDEEKILYKLEEFGAIKINDSSWEYE